MGGNRAVIMRSRLYLSTREGEQGESCFSMKSVICEPFGAPVRCDVKFACVSVSVFDQKAMKPAASVPLPLSTPPSIVQSIASPIEGIAKVTIPHQQVLFFTEEKDNVVVRFQQE